MTDGLDAIQTPPEQPAAPEKVNSFQRIVGVFFSPVPPLSFPGAGPARSKGDPAASPIRCVRPARPPPASRRRIPISCGRW